MKTRSREFAAILTVAVFDAMIVGFLLAGSLFAPKPADLPEIIPAVWPNPTSEQPAIVEVFATFHTTHYSLIAAVPMTLEVVAEFGNYSLGNIRSVYVSFEDLTAYTGKYVSFATIESGGLNVSRIAGQNYTDDATEQVFFPFAGTFEMFVQLYYTNSTGGYLQTIPFNATSVTVSPPSELVNEQSLALNTELNSTNTILAIAVVAFTNIQVFWLIQRRTNSPKNESESAAHQNKSEHKDRAKEAGLSSK